MRRLPFDGATFFGRRVSGGGWFQPDTIFTRCVLSHDSEYIRVLVVYAAPTIRRKTYTLQQWRDLLGYKLPSTEK